LTHAWHVLGPLCLLFALADTAHLPPHWVCVEAEQAATAEHNRAGLLAATDWRWHVYRADCERRSYFWWYAKQATCQRLHPYTRLCSLWQLREMISDEQWVRMAWPCPLPPR
jgi:hypothetical protein